MLQSSAEVEHELLSLSSDSWTAPSSQIRVLLLLSRALPAAGRSPNKHPRTGSEEDSVDIAALLDRAAVRFSACCMDTKVESMMDRLEKRIDEKIDFKLGLVMDRLSVLEKTSSSTRSGTSSLSDIGGSTGQISAAGGAPAVFALNLEIKG